MLCLFDENVSVMRVERSKSLWNPFEGRLNVEIGLISLFWRDIVRVIFFDRTNVP